MPPARRAARPAGARRRTRPAADHRPLGLGPGRARPAGPASYGTIKLAFVHHTDNPNGYSWADVPALLLAIFDYHRFVRGFFDIAYNFIIDPFGRIWEARAGGIDEPVVGAHAGGTTPSRPGSRCSARSCPWSRRRPRSARSSGCSRGSWHCTGSRPWARSRSWSIRRPPSIRRFAPGLTSACRASPATATAI